MGKRDCDHAGTVHRPLYVRIRTGRESWERIGFECRACAQFVREREID